MASERGRNLRGAGQPSYWTLVSLGTLVSQDERSCAASGSLRIRFPVAAKTALARAGPVIDVPGSPSPPGASRLRTRCTSIVGASFIRNTRYSGHLDRSTRPAFVVL